MHVPPNYVCPSFGLFIGGLHVVLISCFVKRSEKAKLVFFHHPCLRASPVRVGQCFLSDIVLIAMMLICLVGWLPCSTFFCLFRCLRVLLAAICCVCGFMFLHMGPMWDVVS